MVWISIINFVVDSSWFHHCGWPAFYCSRCSIISYAYAIPAKNGKNSRLGMRKYPGTKSLVARGKPVHFTMCFSSIILPATVDCRQIDSMPPPQEIRPYFRMIQGSWMLNNPWTKPYFLAGGWHTPQNHMFFVCTRKVFLFLQGPDSLTQKPGSSAKVLRFLPRYGRKYLSFCRGNLGAMEVLGMWGGLEVPLTKPCWNG